MRLARCSHYEFIVQRWLANATHLLRLRKTGARRRQNGTLHICRITIATARRVAVPTLIETDAGSCLAFSTNLLLVPGLEAQKVQSCRPSGKDCSTGRNTRITLKTSFALLSKGVLTDDPGLVGLDVVGSSGYEYSVKGERLRRFP